MEKQKQYKEFYGYIICNDGTIYNKKGKKMKLETVWNGYYRIGLQINGIRKRYKIAYLVAMLFIKNDDAEHKTIVHHCDRNKSNNDTSNLMWMTPEAHRKLHAMFRRMDANRRKQKADNKAE